MQRRDFLKRASAAAAAVGAAGLRAARGAEPPIPRRALGQTGAMVSMIGIGGFHMGQPKDEQVGIRIVQTALDHGVDFLDNCWDYNDGESERRMGKALAGGYRDKAFLMTKIDGRTRDAAAQQIDESLRRLGTDHLDLLQIHEVIRMEDPDRVFAKGGAIEAVAAARQAGKCRFVGFTGHKNPRIHMKMLDAAAAHGFRFDTVQMPLNVMDAHFESFEHVVLPRLVRERIGVLGMKPLGGGVILESKVVQPVECLHYAMSLPTSVVITGCDSAIVLQQALDAARAFKPLSAGERSALLDRTREAAAKGDYEKYKTAHRFDGTYQHPEWLG